MRAVNPLLKTLLIAGALSVATSSCSTISQADIVVEVDGQSVDQETLDRLLTEYSDRSDIFGTDAIGDDLTVDAAQTRLLLSAVVRVTTLSALLATADTSITTADTDLYFANVPDDSPIRELSSEMQLLIATTNRDVVNSALSRVPKPTDAELEASYRHQPISTGLLCVRHILVPTEDEAKTIITKLEGGADFAELAKTESTDTIAASTGGALSGTDSQCLTTSQYVSSFDPGFVRGAFAAPSSGWTAPVKSQFGWHIIMNRPWEEVSADVIASVNGPDGGILVIDGKLNSADIYVDPRYGKWDPPTGRAEPVG